jgi:ketosteroid isomerase-like protein
VSQNVEIVRRGVEAAIRRPKPDFATVNELYHPDHVLISRMNAIEGGSHIGARGYRDWLLSSRDAVEWEQRLDQVTEIDKNRVLAITPGSIRGKSSGIALEEERWASVVTVRGGKIIRTEVYSSPEEALNAVGVG